MWRSDRTLQVLPLRQIRAKYNQTLYGYYFSVILPENINNDDEKLKELLQRVAEKARCGAYATVWNSRQ